MILRKFRFPHSFACHRVGIKTILLLVLSFGAIAQQPPVAAGANCSLTEGAEKGNVGHFLSIHSCTGSFLKCHSRVGPAITFR